MAEKLKRWDGVQWNEVVAVNRMEVVKVSGSDEFPVVKLTIDGLSQSYEYELL